MSKDRPAIKRKITDDLEINSVNYFPKTKVAFVSYFIKSKKEHRNLTFRDLTDYPTQETLVTRYYKEFGENS